jgi:hypothetical protein
MSLALAAPSLLTDSPGRARSLLYPSPPIRDPPSRSSGIVVRLTERAFSQCFPSLKLYESIRRDQYTDDRHFLTLVRDVTGGQALQL